MTHKERHDRRQQIADYARKNPGQTLGKIASQFGVSTELVRDAMEQHQIDTNRSHATGRVRRKAMAEAIQAGESEAKVAKRFGVEVGYVRRAARQNGVLIAAERYKDTSAYDVIGDLCRTTDPLAVVAIRHGLSRARISQIYTRCREVGIPVNRRKQGRSVNLPRSA